MPAFRVQWALPDRTVMQRVRGYCPSTTEVSTLLPQAGEEQRDQRGAERQPTPQPGSATSLGGELGTRPLQESKGSRLWPVHFPQRISFWF